MKQRFWLFRRRNVYYVQDALTRKKESLRTGDKKQAERLRDAKNEGSEKPQFGLAMAKAYLASCDPKLVQRTWKLVMDEFCSKGKESTRSADSGACGLKRLT